LDFVVILAAIPLALAVGSVLFVTSQRVIWDSVKEVLEVVESDTGDLNGAVRLLSFGGRSEYHGEQSE
jgi:hypothetical protein